MYQIFDCDGRAVGRPAGYTSPAMAAALASRRGRVSDALRAAAAAAPADADGRRLFYAVRWIGEDYSADGVNLRNSFNTPPACWI